MATINYNGMELEEFNPNETVAFNPPIKCVGWNSENVKVEFELSSALSKEIWNHRFIGKSKDDYPVAFMFCAILPEKPAPRRATWMELAKWCATGKGLVYDTNRDRIDSGIMFKPDNEHEPIMDELKVRKWDDKEWHTPDVEYMGITEVKTYEDVVKREG